MWTITFILVAAFAAADIIVFEDYKTTFEIKKDVLVVTKELRLKNVGTSPIIPGEIHFKVSERDGDDAIATKISNFQVTSVRGRALESKQVRSERETDLVFTIWDPLLPKFYYDFEMSYEIDFDPSGILFYAITIPDEKTTIPIKNAVTEFLLPKRYHVTFAPEAEIESGDDAHLLRWDSNSDMRFEYSFVPFPKLGFPAVNVFWGGLIALFVIIFVVRIVRSR